MLGTKLILHSNYASYAPVTHMVKTFEAPNLAGCSVYAVASSSGTTISHNYAQSKTDELAARVDCVLDVYGASQDGIGGARLFLIPPIGVDESHGGLIREKVEELCPHLRDIRQHRYNYLSGAVFHQPETGRPA
jgi:hypothetical protein